MEIIAIKSSEGNAHFLISRFTKVSNMLLDSAKDYSKNEILKIEKERWFVEESIKELKQNFDLENFRVRSWHGSQKQIALIFFAATLTHLALLKHNEWIQYVLPQFIEGLCDDFCFSIYQCRKMVLKMLFCGQIPVLANDCLVDYCRSP